MLELANKYIAIHYEKAKVGGEEGIRTLDTVIPYTRLAGERLQPLGHLSKSILPFFRMRTFNMISSLLKKGRMNGRRGIQCLATRATFRSPLFGKGSNPSIRGKFKPILLTFQSFNLVKLSTEGEGFEPPDPCESLVFKTSALNHSAILP